MEANRLPHLALEPRHRHGQDTTSMVAQDPTTTSTETVRHCGGVVVGTYRRRVTCNGTLGTDSTARLGNRQPRPTATPIAVHRFAPSSGPPRRQAFSFRRHCPLGWGSLNSSPSLRLGQREYTDGRPGWSCWPSAPRAQDLAPEVRRIPSANATRRIATWLFGK